MRTLLKYAKNARQHVKYAAIAYSRKTDMPTATVRVSLFPVPAL